MDELKWMYVSVSIEDFQRKIAFAEKLLEKYGAKYVKNIEYKGYWTLGDGPHAYENIQKRIYKLFHSCGLGVFYAEAFYRPGILGQD